MNFDILKSLEGFLAVAEMGSMTLASRRLGVTQSAISQQIKLLEVELGTALFDRQARPLRLTIAGLVLQQRAGRLVGDAREVWVQVRQASAVVLPHLRLAVFSTFARCLVPALMAALESRSLPVQTMSILRGPARHHTHALANREIDVAITSDALLDQDGLDRHELIREQYLVVLPRGTLSGSLDLRAVAARLPFLRYTPGIRSGQLIEQHFRRLRLNTVQRFAFESPDDLVAGVVAGYGWAVVTPSQLAYTLDDPDAVELLPFPRPGLGRSVILVTRKGELPFLAASMSALCRAAIAETLLPRVAGLLPDIATMFTLADDLPPSLVAETAAVSVPPQAQAIDSA